MPTLCFDGESVPAADALPGDASGYFDGDVSPATDSAPWTPLSGETSDALS